MTEKTRQAELTTMNEKARRAYSKPAILSRERLEALAVLCNTGKVDNSTCPAGPIQS